MAAPRRKRRPPPAEGRATAGGWGMRHSPYTVEGEIEGFGRLAGGRGRRRVRSRRLVAGLVLATLAAPAVLGLLQILTR
ncbi:MAG: hypothetical protein ACRD1K_02960 [Acidimicrobiales bacterium]